MQTYPEHMGVEFDAWFEDLHGAPRLPLGVKYRLRDATNDAILIDWTDVSVDLVVDDQGLSGVRVLVDVPGSANVLRSCNKREVRELIVVSGKDHPREASETFTYSVTRSRARI